MKRHYQKWVPKIAYKKNIPSTGNTINQTAQQIRSSFFLTSHSKWYQTDENIKCSQAKLKENIPLYFEWHGTNAIKHISLHLINWVHNVLTCSLGVTGQTVLSSLLWSASHLMPFVGSISSTAGWCNVCLHQHPSH